MAKRKPKSPPRPNYAKQPAVLKIVKLLQRKRGVTIAEIQKATGYTSHGVRSVLSNLRRWSGLNIERARHAKRGNVFRIRGK